MENTAFYTAIGLFALTVVSPGPAVLAILSTGMSQGRHRALVLTAGILSGSFFWGLVALFSFASFLDKLGAVFIYLKVAGAIYLLWLASKALRGALSKTDPRVADVNTKGGLARLYLSGLALHLTNPKAVFGWAATITIGVNATDGFSRTALLVFTCMAIVATLKIAMALAFSSAPAMRFYTRTRRAIQAAVAGLFGTAGMALLTDAVRR